MSAIDENAKQDLILAYEHGVVSTMYFYSVLPSIEQSKDLSYLKNKIKDCIKVFERTFKPLENNLISSGKMDSVEEYFNDKIQLVQSIDKLSLIDFEKVKVFMNEFK
jgi:hypothetical protein